MRFIVSQKGSREHFLAARALFRMGMLAHMVVDWYAPQGRLGKILEKSSSKVISRAFSVRAKEIPDNLITPLNLIGLKDRIRNNILKHVGRSAEATLKGDIQFATAVSRLKMPQHDAFFGFSYSSLEALREETRKRVFCVLDQIDPGEKEHEIIRDESLRWGEYVAHRVKEMPRQLYERLHEEWRLADMIIVNSEWSRECNIEKGAPKEKVVVLPLAYEPLESNANREICDTEQILSSNIHGKVRILWVGRITLQKGIQYLVEAARLLKDDPVEFLVAGDSDISQSSMRSAPSNIRWLGKVSSVEKERLFRSSTAFVLPTLSDGFAMTQLEALSSGLPVIVTPNCGRVVEEGKTGFVIPPRDPKALADTILRFVHCPDLKNKMSLDCKNAVKSYSLDAYGCRLADFINKFSQDWIR